jgi:adenylate kinase family enzyme
MAETTVVADRALAGVAMRRVAVIGCAGAGKSTFAQRLGERLGIPVTHLDTLYWKPGWQETPKDEWAALMGELVTGESWLIDGNYGGTMGQRLMAADTVIYLDVPRRVCMWRVVKRWAMYRWQSRPDMADGCPERLDFKFLKWVWSYRANSRPATLSALDEKDRTGGKVFVLRSNGDIEEFLALAAPTTG